MSILGLLKQSRLKSLNNSSFVGFAGWQAGLLFLPNLFLLWLIIAIL